MLKGILSISGQPGLYKLVAESKKSLIVESLITGKRTPAYSTAKISTLQDIAIYTETGEASLKDVLKNISEKENEQEIKPIKNDKDLKAYFAEILPDYDRDRVYVSDMKKVIRWYNLLVKHSLLNFEEDEAVENSKEENE